MSLHPVHTVLQALKQRGIQATGGNGKWSACCPAHEDQRPSLSISQGEDGRALLHCHAGCDVRSIVGSLGLILADLMAGPPAVARKKPGKPSAKRDAGKGSSQVFATADAATSELSRTRGAPSGDWKYHNADGVEVGRVLRWDKRNGKEIRPVSKCADGWRIGGMSDARPLYGLPEIIKAPKGSRVFVCEGEKTADSMRAGHFLATTSPHGAKAAKKADWSPLAGMDVVVVPDNDEAGAHYARDVVECLQKLDEPPVIRVLELAKEWPELPEGGDFVDLMRMVNSDGLLMVQTVARVKELADIAEPVSSAASEATGSAVLTRLSDVQATPVEWLWDGRFACGKLFLLAGDPGLGKSFASLDIAARVSRGAEWPDGRGPRRAPSSVVLLNAEDDVQDTIRPRLDALGADSSRIHCLQAIRTASAGGKSSERPFDLARDLGVLDQVLAGLPACRLVVIDPITAYLGQTDSHKNADVRALLAPLVAIASKHRVAVIAVTHLNKTQGGAAIYRAMGSLAFAAAARGAWVVVKDPKQPQRRLMLPLKNNLASDTGGLAYAIEAESASACPRVVWEPDPVMLTADEAMAAEASLEPASRTECEDAESWLVDYLRAGPKPCREVEADAVEAGFTLATLRRAKPRAGVEVIKTSYRGVWLWSLPGAHADDQASKDLFS